MTFQPMKQYAVELMDMRTTDVVTVPMFGVSAQAAADGARQRQDSPAEFAVIRVTEK